MSSSSEEQQRALGRIEGKMDLLLESHNKLIERHDDHDTRLRKLEGYKKYLMGAIAVCSFSISYVIDWLKR